MPGSDPWTDPDPQPGDFDAELEAQLVGVEFHPGAHELIEKLTAESRAHMAVLTARREWAAANLPGFAAIPDRGLAMHVVAEPSMLFTIDVCRTCGRQATWPFCDHRPRTYVPYEPGALSWCFPVRVRVVQPSDFRREMRRGRRS